MEVELEEDDSSDVGYQAVEEGDAEVLRHRRCNADDGVQNIIVQASPRSAELIPDQVSVSLRPSVS
jgi:hypothetical protein